MKKVLFIFAMLAVAMTVAAQDIELNEQGAYERKEVVQVDSVTAAVLYDRAMVALSEWTGPDGKAKAGETVSGGFSVERAVKEGKARLVVVALEASDNTKKMFRNMCEFYKVPGYFYGTKEGLGHFMGKEFRASMAVTDEGLAKAVEKQLVLAGIERQ